MGSFWGGLRECSLVQCEEMDEEWGVCGYVKSGDCIFLCGYVNVDVKCGGCGEFF